MVSSKLSLKWELLYLFVFGQYALIFFINYFSKTATNIVDISINVIGAKVVQSVDRFTQNSEKGNILLYFHTSTTLSVPIPVVQP